MSTESLKIGYFGKVPTHGDFINKSLPQSFINPWDTWLEEAVLSSRQQLGENWLNYYLTSPIYRFALSPGICGRTGWSGVVMPSVDKVGRYYPMTLGVMGDQNTNPFITLEQNRALFDQLETLVLSCLEDNFILDHFQQSLSQIQPVVNQQATDVELPAMQREEEKIFHAYHLNLNSPDSIFEFMPDFLDQVLKEFGFAYSVWWTMGSEHVTPSLLICEGLPPFDGIAAMFDGNWQAWGWKGKQGPLNSHRQYDIK